MGGRGAFVFAPTEVAPRMGFRGRGFVLGVVGVWGYDGWGWWLGCGLRVAASVVNLSSC